MCSQSDQSSDDGTRKFLRGSHTVLGLILISSVLLYVTWQAEPANVHTLTNIKKCKLAAVLVSIVVGIIYMTDGSFVRRHPEIWKFVLCIMVVYILFLIFILFQSADDARQFLKFYDPQLGMPLTVKTYADDCHIYTPGHPNGTFATIIDNMDGFAISHFVGWYLKALIIRDFWILTSVSIIFELLEYTLQWQLPFLEECWWDHWILDFLICNGLGIYLGMKTCEYLSIKKYHWLGTTNHKGNLKQLIHEITPYTWESYQWGYTQSFSRFIAVVLLIIFWLLQEFNVFYLMTVLWIPTENSLHFYREMLYALCGACGVSEYYNFLQSRDPHIHFGQFSWLLGIAVITETLIVLKFGWNVLTIPIPQVIVIGWALFFLALSVWVTWKFTAPLKEIPIIKNYLQGSFKKKTTFLT